MSETIVQVFWERAKNSPEKTAILHKLNGSYKPVLWQEQAQLVESLSAALLGLGLNKNDKVAIASTSCAKWTWADLSILSIACVTVPIYPSLNAEEMEYLITHSDAVGIFLENARQLNKLLSMPSLPKNLRFAVILDNEEILSKSNLQILSWDKFLKEGQVKLLANKSCVQDIVKTITADDLSTIVYTSGTTGVPKGAMIKHGNIIFVCSSLSKFVGFNSDDLALSFLPLSHIFERVGGQFLCIYEGITLAYAESMESIADNIVEVRPTIMNAVPRFYEKVYNRIQSQIRHLPTPQQYFARWALSIGKRALKANKSENKDELGSRIYRTELKVAERFVFRKIKQRFGGRLRFLASGAAPLAQEVQQFFEIVGLPVLEGYGLTETTAPASCNTILDNNRGTVGKALPGVQIKIAADGEILVKGPSVFSGYYKNQEATEQAFTDGWFMTGDIGELDSQGYLRIKDRKKDIIITAGGKHVAPQLIENLLVGKGAISRVLVYGDKRKYISCLITLNPEELQAFAKQKGLSFSNIKELSKHPEVLADLQELVDAANKHLASFEQIKRFLVLDTDFSIESGELTPTLKLKRKFVTEKHKNLLDSLYDQEDIQLEKVE